VSSLSEGDEVFGFVPGTGPTVQNGSWAELVAVPESVATRKPADIDTASAGAAPVAAITAISALDALGVSEGDTVLIVGANGGVGSLAVQLAAASATVIALALPEDEEYLRELGISEVLPREADVAALVHERYPEGIEALLDLVSYAPEGFDAPSMTTGAAPRHSLRPGKDRSATT
jgi:NADPH2:quinone reductase